jgi:PAS domain S-box-containing protein
MAKDDPIPIDDQTLSLRQIIDSAPALLHTGWPEGHRDFLNQTWLRYGRRSPEDLQGWEWTAFVHPENVEGIVEKWHESLASGEPLLHEARILRADGEYRWMLSHKWPYFCARMRSSFASIPVHTGRPDGYLDYFNQRWLGYEFGES